MTFALFPEEQAARIDALPGVKLPEPGAFTGFLRGTGMGVMKGLAQIPRAAGMLLSTAAVAEDAYYGGTTAQDKYFKWHDDVFNRAVDYWTPKPHEVGVAGEVAGQLLSMLPQVMISPPVAIATTQMATGEDLVRKGVDAGKAATVGAVQGATLATGIWMPILGKTGFQRAVIGGAGFNVLQGTVSRGVSGEILEGTPAAKDFQAFDGKALTLDVLLGLAFGGLAHLSPRQRAHGEAAWQRIEAWTKGMKPSDVDALATLRQAQHLNTDSSPVIPAGLADIDAHTQRMRTALDQLTQDLLVRVEDLPEARGEVDAARVAESEKRIAELTKEAERIANAEGMFFHGTNRDFKQFDAGAEKSIQQFNDAQGFYFSRRAEDAATYARGEGANIRPVFLDFKNPKIIEDGELPPSYVSPETRADLEAQGFDAIVWRGGDEVVVFRPEQIRSIFDDQAKTTGTVDPLRSEAERFATENPDFRMVVGKDADGKDIAVTPKQYLEQAQAEAQTATENVRLFEIAAACMLGAR